MRPFLALSLVFLVVPPLNAQLCYHARPKPDCSAFVTTDFGAYLLLGADAWGESPFREVADWGVMVNVGERAAVGASFVASLDRAGLLVGPEVRYRRWLSASAALDVALGTPLVTSTGDIAPGSIQGLVRWSPSDWVAVAARPEALRYTSTVSCGPAGCTTATRLHPRLSLGLEIGRVPGAVFTGLGAVATYLVALAVINSD